MTRETQQTLILLAFAGFVGWVMYDRNRQLKTIADAGQTRKLPATTPEANPIEADFIEYLLS